MSLQAIYNPKLGDKPLLIDPNIIEVTLYAGARETLHQAYPAIPSIDIPQTCDIHKIDNLLVGFVSELSYTVETLFQKNSKDARAIIDSISQRNMRSRYMHQYHDTCCHHMFWLQKTYNHAGDHKTKKEALHKKNLIAESICEATNFRKNRDYLYDLAEVISRIEAPFPI